MLVPKVHLNKTKNNPYESPKKYKISRGDQVKYSILTIDPYLDADLINIDIPSGDAYRYDEIDESNAIKYYNIKNVK